MEDGQTAGAEEGKVKLILLALLLTACSGAAPTADPRVQAAAANEADRMAALDTAKTQVAANATFIQVQTETAIPPQLTRLANDNQSTAIANDMLAQRATSEALNSASAITATLAALQVLESETQKTIAENNAAIANATNGANFWRDVLTYGAGIVLGGMGGFVIWFLLQGGMVAVTWRKQAQKQIEFDTAMRAYKETQKAANPDGGDEFLLTSAGPMRRIVAPKAEQHKTQYSQEQLWRAACKKLIDQGVIAGQGGAKHPFSETTLSPFVSRPDVDGVWVDGYRKISRVLQANEIWYVAGPRIAPEWGAGWNWDKFSREFDLTPLHHLPEGNPPDVKTPAWSFAESA